MWAVYNGEVRGEVGTRATYKVFFLISQPEDGHC